MAAIPADRSHSEAASGVLEQSKRRRFDVGVDSRVRFDGRRAYFRERSARALRERKEAEGKKRARIRTGELGIKVNNINRFASGKKSVDAQRGSRYGGARGQAPVRAPAKNPAGGPVESGKKSSRRTGLNHDYR